MKAVVHDGYGPPEVLRLEDVEPPVPQADEILVRIRATTVNRTDCHRRAADPVMWRLLAELGRPRRRVLGSELAGEVAAAGQAVTEFAPGDQVFGLSPWQLGAGEYRPVVDRCYPLEQVVEATRYVETRQRTGNVVLTVSDGRR